MLFGKDLTEGINAAKVLQHSTNELRPSTRRSHYEIDKGPGPASIKANPTMQDSEGRQTETVSEQEAVCLQSQNNV